MSIAFLVALVGIAAVFLILTLAGLDKSVAGPIATAIMGGIPYVRESLLILVAVMLVSSAFAGMSATATRAGTMEAHRAIADNRV